jgi:hypothetical protein
VEAFATRHICTWEPNLQMGGALDHAAVSDAIEAQGGSGRRPGQRPDVSVVDHVRVQNASEIEAGAGGSRSTTVP